jgi:hypothetical protein
VKENEMSSGYRCEKCGETASSKCIHQRSVFPQDMLATVFGNMVKLQANRAGATKENWRRESDSNVWITEITIRCEYVHANSENEAIQDLVNDVVGLAKDHPESFRRALCDHDWRITEGTCMFGCCVAK